MALEQEWNYYQAHRPELVKQYLGKYVVISGDKVVAAYNGREEGYQETVKTIQPGNFMIHHVTDPEEVIRLSPFANV
jgi:hypothetical protein